MGLRENLQESGSKGLFSPQNSGFPGRHSLKTDSEKKRPYCFWFGLKSLPAASMAITYTTYSYSEFSFKQFKAIAFISSFKANMSFDAGSD